MTKFHKIQIETIGFREWTLLDVISGQMEVWMEVQTVVTLNNLAIVMAGLDNYF